MRVDDLPLDSLLLDPNNYRLQDGDGYAYVADERIEEEQVQKKTAEKLGGDALRDLSRSIRANGFLPIERIVVTPYPTNPEKYVVIEGNRRVAALRLIRDSYQSGVEVRDDLIATFEAVPCIVAEDEGVPYFKEALMGIRHLGGIKEWGGYQRAKLIADLRDTHHLEANDVADRLGMSIQEVNRRYRAFKALQQMQEDDDFGEYAKPSAYPLFHEAVSLPVVRDWLGWNAVSGTFDNDTELEYFYRLITPPMSDDNGEEAQPKLRTYSDIRDLRPILSNEEAKICLLDPTRSFIDAQTIARRDEISQQWKNEVSEAMTALKKISALEVKTFNEFDVAILTNLKKATEDIIEIYEAIKS
jgi:ParB-like nuclease domain